MGFPLSRAGDFGWLSKAGCLFMVREPNPSSFTFPTLCRVSLMANGFLIPNGALCVVGEGVVVQGRRFEFHAVLTRFSVLEEVVYLAHPGPGICFEWRRFTGLGGGGRGGDSKGAVFGHGAPSLSHEGLPSCRPRSPASTAFPFRCSGGGVGKVPSVPSCPVRP